MRRLPWDKTETRRQKLEGGKTPTPPFWFLLSAFISLCLCASLVKVSVSAQKPSGPASKASPEVRERFDEARRLLQGGYPDSALASVQQGLKVAPKSVEGLNLLGLIYLQKHDYPEAEKAFEDALKEDPRSTETHNNLGNTYYAQQKLDLAEQEFRKTLRALQPGASLFSDGADREGAGGGKVTFRPRRK